MKIVYKQGDVLQCSEDAILHGCNAQGVMGAGIAKMVKETFPSAYEAYRRSYNLGECYLGSVTVAVSDLGHKYILNGVTQEFYGRNSDIVYVDYKALAEVISRVDRWTKYNYVTAVAMPKIGAGLANGDWEIISEIIEQYSTNFVPVVYTL